MDIIYKSSMFIILVFGLSSTVFHCMKRMRKKPLTPAKRQINDVLIFCEADQLDLIQSKYSRSLIPLKMDRLLFYLSLARNSLDICMYMITNCDIAHLIQRLHNRGVKVRFIVDADMAYSTGSATKRIEKAGIELRWMKSTNLMHHKFCLIDAANNIEDKNALSFVMIGSLNWTNAALNKNWENVLVTSNTDIVTGLKQEFDKLWEMFKPIV